MTLWTYNHGVSIPVSGMSLQRLRNLILLWSLFSATPLFGAPETGELLPGTWQYWVFLVSAALFALFLLVNGVIAAASPDRWVRSQWTFSGIVSEPDLEGRWMRAQIRVMGAVFALVGMLFLAYVFGLSAIVSVVSHVLVILVLGFMIVGSAAAFVWPERNLFHAFRQNLSEDPRARSLCLLVLRLFALLVFVMVIVAVRRVWR